VAAIGATTLCIVDLARAQSLDLSPRRCEVDVINEITPNVSDRRVAIRVGSFDSRWASPMMTNFGQRAGFLPFRPKEQAEFTVRDDRLAEFEVVFGRDLTEALVGAGYRISEAIENDPDLVLHAGLTGVNQGNRAKRVFGTGLASAGVRAVLADRQGRPTSVFNCWRAFGGGFFGTGGLFSLGQSAESLLRDNSKQIAQSLVQKIGEIPKLGQDLAGRQRNRIDVAQHNCQTNVWRERPVDRWSLQDATKVLGAFMLRTFRGGCPPIITRGVDAMWLTAHVVRAMRRADELFARDENSTMHPFLLAFDEEIRKSIETSDAYAIAVWPFDGVPYYWNREQIMDATFLQLEKSAERIRPIGLIGPPWPPALFLFPRTSADGGLLIDSLKAKLELHTNLNGRQIVARFDMSRFELRDISELTASAALP
jgi:hypothetical protein